MELTVLGSGTSVPHRRRSSAGFWLKTKSGTLLLDCAASAVHRMAQEGLDWANLDAIWISHFHLDHCAGLAPFLFGTKYAPVTQERSKPLRIIGPRGLRNLIEAFSDANDYDLLSQPFELEIVEVEPLEPFKIFESVEGVCFSTPHTAESLALHVRQDDTTFVYTSDTGFSELLATFARRIDLLLMECSFFRNKPVKKHLELIEAVQLIRMAEPKIAILAHLYPEWDEIDFEKEVSLLKPGIEIVQAYDGLRVDMGQRK